MIERRYTVRVALVAVVLLGGWAVLGLRLTQLHLGPNTELHAEIARLRSWNEEILVGRGRVLDRNGNLLALDVTVQNVVVTPEEILRSNQVRTVSAHLSRVLGLPYAQVHDRVNRPGRKYEAVKRRVTDAEAARVEALQLTGVWFEPVSARQYPQGELACHVVGFSNMEGVGSAGTEQRWNSLLKGRPGMRVSEKDGRRKEIVTRRKLDVAPQEGANVYLTIDQNIQHFTEKGLDWAMTNFSCEAAWAVVEDVRTGEILAMAARPAYDPNEYGSYERPMRMNRAIEVNYEPGSVFKVGVVAAALNEGIVATNDVFDCEDGLWYHAGKPLRDFHPNGELDVAGILRESSNIGAAKIALLLGEERLYRYLKSYGLGRRTGIELPGEGAGILFSPRHWTKLSVSRIAMGHEVAVTALQMLNVLCCIGNDGFLMKPHIVSRVSDKDGVLLQETKPAAVARPITERTAAVMRRLLAGVVNDPDGTGSKAAIPGYTVGGKTGTAEKIGPDGRYLRRQNIASFMGLVPAERPEIGIIVVLDHPKWPRTGGQTAAPTFAQIALPTARYLDIRTDDQDRSVPTWSILQEEDL